MIAAAHLRKGWCPGALRPMPAKDGLLLRLRLSCGVLSSDAARLLARAGRDHGNGLFDLSSRANLQMRGVSERNLPELTRLLDDLGLLDQDAAAEAIRNVLASPLAESETRQIATSLEAALVRQTEIHALPGKFGFLIDDGGALSLSRIPADVRFDYSAAQNAFAVAIGGEAADATFLGYCAPSEIVDAALRLARAFLRLGSFLAEPPRRMRELVLRCDAGSIAAAAGFRLTPRPKRETSAEPCPIGLTELAPEKFCFGVGAPFGRLDARMLETISSAAEIFGQGEVRLTPWRAGLLPCVDAAQEAALKAHFAAAAFVTDPADPRLAVAACGGAAACESGATPTHEDALALAPIARRLQDKGVALHISGCAKGCARQAPTPYTLVANAGRYDLVLQATPRDASAFQGLTLAEVARKRAPSHCGKIEIGAGARTIMTATTMGPKRFDYIRDGAEIYRRSFATIRAEADLARFSPDEERVAVRIIHACGMVEIAADLIFSPEAATRARRALKAGAPILCDSKMVAQGVTRARLPKDNDVICALDDPAVAALAEKIGNTRSAAALELWRARLDGAIVAIGNAPTALFHLLDMLGDVSARPACIIGMPVGFVGADESKEALIASAPTPFITVKGRKGGSAMAAAALNALASEIE